MMKYAKLLLMMAAFGALLYLVLDSLGSNPKPEPKPEPKPIIDTFTSIWNEFNDLRDELKKEDITFDRIREMSDWLSANEGKFTNKPELSDFTEFKGRIDAYLQVINVVESPSQNRTWAKIKEEAAKHQKQLDSVHYAYLRKIWWIGKNSKDFDVVITHSQEKEVNMRLKSDPVYHSFRDIPNAKDILRKHENDRCPSMSVDGPDW